MTVHVNVELTDTQKDLLDGIAQREGASAETLIAQLVQARLDYDLRFREAVAEGLAAVDRGDTVAHEDVVARAKARAARLAAR